MAALCADAEDCWATWTLLPLSTNLVSEQPRNTIRE